jgi:hypothetical protein
MNTITITPTIELETELTQAEAIEAFHYLIKMPQIKDPDWTEPDPNPDNEVAPMVNKFTNMGHLEDYLEGHIMHVINNGLKAKAKADAPIVKRK